MKKFQKTYEVFADLEETRENLKQLGYNPIPIPSSRNPEINTDNFTFKFMPNVKVNVYPKGKYLEIQVAWNSIEEPEKNEPLLMKILGKGLMANWGQLDKFLEEVEIAYLKYMRPYRSERYFRKMEKVKRLFSDKRL